MIHICPACGASWDRADSRRDSCPLCGARSTGYFTAEGCRAASFKRWQVVWREGQKVVLAPWERVRRHQQEPLKCLKPAPRWGWTYVAPRRRFAPPPPSLAISRLTYNPSPPPRGRRDAPC